MHRNASWPVGGLIVLLLAGSLYAADQWPDYPVRAIGDYPNSMTTGGLTIAVEPLEDQKAQKTHFNTEFGKKGFLPVLVVIQNASNSDSFLIAKDKITYGFADGALSTPEAKSKAGSIVGGASLAALSLGGAVFAMKLISNATKVQQNILKKELQSNTLSPGASTHGFLYVPVPKEGSRARLLLRFLVARVGSDETLSVELQF
jgi:hypothetical protein